MKKRRPDPLLLRQVLPTPLEEKPRRAIDDLMDLLGEIDGEYWNQPLPPDAEDESTRTRPPLCNITRSPDEGE